jgi:hypothetical protein
MQRPTDGSATNPIVLFNHQNLKPGFGQIAGCRQPIVPGPGDDRVKFAVFCHGPSHFACRLSLPNTSRDKIGGKVFLSAQINILLLTPGSFCEKTSAGRKKLDR